MPTSLQAIAIKAKREPKHRFQNLYGLVDTGLLAQSYYQLNRKASKGVDGRTWISYQDNLATNLSDLTDRLKRQTYKTKLIKRVFIPKGKDKVRPLGIPSLEDKIVQSATTQVLQSIYEQDFLDTSFGYRPGKSPHQAIHCLNVNLQYGKYGYAVEADIKGFFDNIDHDWLLKMLALRIDDKAMLNLISKWLKSGIKMPDGEVTKPSSGSPQGGLISPILANIYLHYALDIWFYQVVKPRLKGDAMLVRFADDFVCTFQLKRDAERFYRVLPKRLAKFNLAIAPEKTRLMRFSRFRPSRKRCMTFLGFELYWGKDRMRKARLHRRTAKKKLRSAIKDIGDWIKENRHKPIAYFFKAINQKLRGHFQYFGLIGNSNWLWQYYKEVVGRIYKWLNRRSQRKSYTWATFKAMLRHYQLVKPKTRKLNLPRIYLMN